MPETCIACGSITNMNARRLPTGHDCDEQLRTGPSTSAVLPTVAARGEEEARSLTGRTRLSPGFKRHEHPPETARPSTSRTALASSPDGAVPLPRQEGGCWPENQTRHPLPLVVAVNK